jgi:hypothetical protein
VTEQAQTAQGRRAWFGLIRRKEAWVLTWRAWLLLTISLAGTGFLFMRGAYAFLAVHQPNDSGVLVIEGWVPRYALTGYVARCSNYTMIYTIGGPTRTDRHSNDESDTYASVAQARLVRSGVPVGKVRGVPCWTVQRDRTYASAVALREWCASNHVEMAGFNVVTLGPHARRSRLMFERAFKDRVQVGVVALTNEDYDADHWWRYSEGVKETLSEGVAYLYARIFFHPGQ